MFTSLSYYDLRKTVISVLYRGSVIFIWEIFLQEFILLLTQPSLDCISSHRTGWAHTALTEHQGTELQRHTCSHSNFPLHEVGTRKKQCQVHTSWFWWCHFSTAFSKSAGREHLHPADSWSQHHQHPQYVTARPKWPSQSLGNLHFSSWSFYYLKNWKGQAS